LLGEVRGLGALLLAAAASLLWAPSLLMRLDFFLGPLGCLSLPLVRLAGAVRGAGEADLAWVPCKC